MHSPVLINYAWLLCSFLFLSIARKLGRSFASSKLAKRPALFTLAKTILIKWFTLCSICIGAGAAANPAVLAADAAANSSLQDRVDGGGILHLSNGEEIADNGVDALWHSLVQQDVVRFAGAANELPSLEGNLFGGDGYQHADGVTAFNVFANTPLMQQQQQQQQQQQPSNPDGDGSAKKRGGSDSGSRTPSPASKKVKQVRAVAEIAIFFNKSIVNC